MTDDDAIHEFRTRLLVGRYGDRELLMDADRDYSGMWSALCGKLVEWETRFGFGNPVVHEVRTAMNALADARPDAVRVFALNTTHLGRENEYV